MRIAFSSSMFAGLNENDARAAVRVWAEAVINERDLAADPNILLYNSTEKIVQSLTAGDADAIVLTLPELAHLIEHIECSHLFKLLPVGGDSSQYVLLASAAGDPGEQLASLAGEELLLLDNAQSSLALPWLDQVLRQRGLPAATTHFSKITHTEKLSKAVLPVFFGQRAACLVPKHGFDTMRELNPQIGRQLHPIAISPEVIPRLVATRMEYRSPQLPKLVEALTELQDSPAGQQILLIFQTEKVVEITLEDLAPSLELLSSTPSP